MWLISLLFVATFAANPAVLKKLPNTVQGAACLDGSPPAYYFAKGFGTGAHKWLLFFEGGGWCVSIEDCYKRSKGTLGSSTTYPETVDLGGGYFSMKPSVNPVMYNWNKVYFKYCDGASFSGNNASIQNFQGHKLYFRGFLNLQAYLKDLIANQALGRATHAVVSGCSAGGLATYLHADWWAQHLKNANVKAMPDSGFFLDYNAPGNGPKYGRDMRWVFEAQACREGVNQRCIEHNKGKEANCFFAEHTSPHVATPLFPLQSEYDSWQADHVLGSKDVGQLNGFGKELTNRFHVSVLKNPRNGAFLDSCFHHCGEWDNIRISGDLTGQAMYKWYDGHKAAYIQGKPYRCDACCHP